MAQLEGSSVANMTQRKRQHRSRASKLLILNGLIS